MKEVLSVHMRMGEIRESDAAAVCVTSPSPIPPQFLFKDVKYMQLQVDSLTIHNGPVPCQFEFINKLDEETYCKPWLIANPSKGFLLPGDVATM